MREEQPAVHPPLTLVERDRVSRRSLMTRVAYVTPAVIVLGVVGSQASQRFGSAGPGLHKGHTKGKAKGHDKKG